MVKKIASGILLFVCAHTALSQSIDQIINAIEVERIEKTLSSDEMRGRKAGTPDIDRAADFIASEFKKAGIQPIKGSSYFQEFNMLSGKTVSLKAELNGSELPAANVAVVTPNAELSVNQSSGYEVIKGESANKVYDMMQASLNSGKNYLVLLDTSNAGFLRYLRSYNRQMFNPTSNFVFILTNVTPSAWSVSYKQELKTLPYKNVVGIIPGKSKKEEFFIFSGHYDHLGIKPNAQGDSIYNGANDDAAGTTAVIMLAHYFAKQKNNERTLVFAAFTAEEVGGYGSRYFSQQFDPAKVAGMFNIEMIGTESKWGTNSAYITGYERTDMGKILEKNLVGSKFKFYPDPYPKQDLFFRSDNATLAKLGVPAHTISTSKMGTPPEEASEPNYHKVSDEIGTLDMKNMAEIIKAIAISSASMIAGKDTPSRVDTTQLGR